jgi:nucleoside-diphosphate-sugar epimerase
MSESGVRELVTGGTGFIGRRVVAALLDAGADVAVLARETKKVDPSQVERVRVLQHDLTNPGELASAVAAWRPSITFNLAAYGVGRAERDDVTAHHVNMLAVTEAIEAISSLIDDPWQGPRIVQAGSSFEYGAIEQSQDEKAQPLPTTTYGQTKLAATTLLQYAREETGFPSVTARIFTVFGPGEKVPRLFPTLLEARKSAGRIPLTIGTQPRDWLYVDDAAEGLLRLGLVPKETIVSGKHPFDTSSINLASGKLTTVKDFALAAAKVLGIDASRLGFGDIPLLSEDTFQSQVPVARLKAATGWLPPPGPASGLERAAKELLERRL